MMTLASHGRTFHHYHSARSKVALAAVNNNAIIVIGGSAKGWSLDNALSSSLTTANTLTKSCVTILYIITNTHTMNYNLLLT